MPAIARQHLEQEAKSIAAHQWDLDDLLARQIKYYAELALIEACTGHMEQATDHLIRVLGLEYRQGEHSRSETRDHLARQENALARLELEAASCPQAQRWMRASRRRWEQVCQCLYRGDAEWASGLLTAAIGSWQAQLQQVGDGAAGDPWRLFAVSQCEARLEHMQDAIAVELRCYIDRVDRLDDHTVLLGLVSDWWSLPAYIESWLLLTQAGLEASVAEFNGAEDRTEWEIRFSSDHPEGEQADRGYLAANHLIELLSPFARNAAPSTA